MTRDSESLIEVLICVLIATTLIASAGSESWFGSNDSPDSGKAQPTLLITAESIFLQDSVDQKPLNHDRSTTILQVEKISGLFELNKLLFAKPVNHHQNKTARQSC